jgi:hypothetical protein
VRTVRVRSDAIDLKVRPQPAAFTGSHWLPAADLKLEETWTQNPPHIKAGEPITRTLSLRAEGATVSVLPELSGDSGLDASIKHYPDQPSLNEQKQPLTGITGLRQEKTALIPSKPGEYKLPAVEIPWWNTKTDRLEIARIPERVLKVAPSAEPMPQTAPPGPTPQTSAEPAPSPQTVPAPVKPLAWATDNLWFWLTWLFATAWFATGLAWWWSRRTAKTVELAPTAESRLDGRKARKALQQACSKHDPATARMALLAWAQSVWPQQQPATLDEIGRLGGEVLALEISKLNRVLYSSSAQHWQGSELWEAVEAISPEAKKATKETLEPLYR